MAKVTEVTATLARLIALPKFENIRFESSVTMTVEPDEEPKAVFILAMDMCRDNVRTQIERFHAED